LISSKFDISSWTFTANRSKSSGNIQ
jgi:hypothetical protein